MQTPEDFILSIRRHVDAVLTSIVESTISTKQHSDDFIIPNTWKNLPPLVGIKGKTFMESGYVYAPYIPSLIQTTLQTNQNTTWSIACKMPNSVSGSLVALLGNI